MRSNEYMLIKRLLKSAESISQNPLSPTPLPFLGPWQCLLNLDVNQGHSPVEVLIRDADFSILLGDLLSQNPWAWDLAGYFSRSHQVIRRPCWVWEELFSEIKLGKTRGIPCRWLHEDVGEQSVQVHILAQPVSFSWEDIDVTLFIWLPSAQESCPDLATEYPHQRFLPGALTSGPCFPTLIRHLLYSAKKPPIPFCILKFIFRIDTPPGCRNPKPHGLGSELVVIIPSTLHGERAGRFLWQPVGFLGSVSTRFWAEGETRWPQWLGTGSQWPCIWPSPPFERGLCPYHAHWYLGFQMNQ